jgi:hypothetical protein
MSAQGGHELFQNLPTRELIVNDQYGGHDYTPGGVLARAFWPRCNTLFPSDAAPIFLV